MSRFGVAMPLDECLSGFGRTPAKLVVIALDNARALLSTPVSRCLGSRLAGCGLGTGNTFFSTLAQNAGIAVDTRGGRSTISNNTANGYATLANVAPSPDAAAPLLNPNNVVVANNSITCAQMGITLGAGGASGRTIQNVSITSNSISICNGVRAYSA